MEPPTKGDELLQLVCAAGWMRHAIPDFTRLVAPLHKVLEEVYTLAGGRRTKRAAAKILLEDTSWKNGTAMQSFDDLKAALANSVTLAHRDVHKRLCLFTDASDTHWASVLTQVPLEDMASSVDQQRHEPLAFMSGVFSGPSSRWSTIEKEGFAIVESLQKLEYLCAIDEGVSIFTDHRNLLFIFNPRGIDPSMGAH
jgi:hypothetical protein